MSRRLNPLFVALATVLLLSLAGSAAAQAEAKPGRTDPIKRPNNKVEAAQDKGWDGKVQFATPIKISFDNPADYDSFAAGTLNLSFTLRNTLSGKTIVFEPKMVREGFRPSATDKSAITIWLVVENPSAPLAEAACVETKLGAERMRDGSGVNISVDYAACGGGAGQTDATGTAQRPGNPIHGIIVKGGKNEGSQMVAGQPIGGIIVKGGKNPGGNMLIAAGNTQSGPEVGNAAMMTGPNIIVRKGAGSPKAQGW
jgi:hypothetical protein